MFFKIFTYDSSKEKTEDKKSVADTQQKPEATEADISLSEIPVVDDTSKETVTEEVTPSEEAPKEPQAENADEKKKASLSERFEEIKPFIPAGKKALKKLLKMIRIKDLYISMLIGSDDAYKAGINFGRANQAFYPALAAFCRVFKVKIKKTEIKCDYTHKVFDLTASAKILIRPSAIIALAVYVGIQLLKFKLKNKGKKDNENERKEQ